MKRINLFLIIFLLGIGPLWADSDAGTKLARGVHNAAFGWFEIVNEMTSQADQHGVWIGFPAGILRGAAFGLLRTMAGAYEIVTFLLPNGEKGYDPVILPESVFRGGK